MLKLLLLPVLLITSVSGCSSVPENVTTTNSLHSCNVATTATVNHGVKVQGATIVQCGEQSTLITKQCITRYKSVPPNGELFIFKCPDDNGGFYEGEMITYY